MEEKVASSAAGELWRARQPALDRQVWVRALGPALRSAPGVADRFLREARLGARVSHPNLLTVHDCFAEGEAYYLVYERMEGGELSSLCIAPPRMPVKVALAIVLEIGRGLAALHERRVVYRALAPDRVTVSRWGDVKLGDLGDALELDRDTPAGRVSPSPYVAPEIVAGAEADGSADVYSLGAVLHDMLAGEPPSARTAELRGVDAQVVRLVKRALAPHPGERPRLAELLRVLEERSRARTPEACRSAIATWLFERARAAGTPREPELLQPSDFLRASVGRTLRSRASLRRLPLPKLDGTVARARELVGRAQHFGAKLLERMPELPALPHPTLRVPVAIGAGVLAGIGLFWIQRGGDELAEVSVEPIPAVSAAGAAARVRFVAIPWAEISIDGGPSFVTPRAAPLELSPGRHQVRFAHPSYGSVERTIDVAAGSVEMVRHRFGEAGQ